MNIQTKIEDALEQARKRDLMDCLKLTLCDPEDGDREWDVEELFKEDGGWQEVQKAFDDYKAATYENAEPLVFLGRHGRLMHCVNMPSDCEPSDYPLNDNWSL